MQLDGKVVTFTLEDLGLEPEEQGDIPIVWDFNDPQMLQAIDYIIPEECMSQSHVVLETDTQILVLSTVNCEDTNAGVGVYLIEKDE